MLLHIGAYSAWPFYFFTYYIIMARRIRQRKNRKSGSRNLNNQIEKLMQARLMPHPANPPDIKQTVTIKFVARQGFSLTSGSAGNFNPSAIIATTPGGGAAWKMMRLRKITVWGPSDFTNSGTNVTSLPSISLLDSLSQMTFMDAGVAGQRRPCVSMCPSLDQQLIWYPTTSGTTLASVSVLANGALATDKIWLLADFELELSTAIGPLA